MLTKKIILLIFIAFICISNVGAMEQSLDLIRVMETLPEKNSIVCWLDSKSFSALTQVCVLSQAICDSIHTKYLAIDFSDAAEYGNKNLIKRFINQMGSIIEPGLGEEVMPSSGKIWHKNNTIKIFKQIIKQGMESYFGDYKCCCVTEKEKIVRYLFEWKDDIATLANSKRSCAICFNNEECNDDINRVSRKLMSFNVGNIHTKMAYGEVDLKRECSKTGCYFHRRPFGFTGYPFSGENFFKKLSQQILINIAIEKNHLLVVEAMLDLEFFEFFVVYNDDRFCSQEIKDMVRAAFSI